VKFSEFLTELRDALTVPTRGNLIKAILLLLSILVVALGLSFLLHHFFSKEELERFAEYGYLGVFLVTLVSSLSVVLPLPGTVVVIAAAGIWNTPLVALVASIGGTLGEVSAYMVGYGGRAFIAPEQSERYQTAERWMKRHGGFAIFLFALVPFLIFDFVGIAAGVFRYPLKKFFLFTWLGRLPRSFIECYVGAPLLDFILEHLPF
jgi:uncharacterized membrane protein YdjX (TVP38/TMEM64 family)